MQEHFESGEGVEGLDLHKLNGVCTNPPLPLRLACHHVLIYFVMISE